MGRVYVEACWKSAIPDLDNDYNIIQLVYSLYVYIPQFEVGRVSLEIIFFCLTGARLFGQKPFVRFFTVIVVCQEIYAIVVSQKMSAFLNVWSRSHLHRTVRGIIIFLGQTMTFTVENTVWRAQCRGKTNRV